MATDSSVQQQLNQLWADFENGFLATCGAQYIEPMFGVGNQWLSRLAQRAHLLTPARWPSSCHICKSWPRHSICEACIQRFAQPQLRCKTCALKVSELGCRCVQEPPPIDACLCAVDYDFPWADCVKRLKFHNSPQSAQSLAELMRHAPWVEAALDQAHWVIPVPISAQRLRERGYNQALELSRRLAPAKLLRHALLRHHGASHQVGASRKERLENMADSFWIAPGAHAQLVNQRIVLVDDVMTSGATLFEAARCLRQAGAAHITGLVFARTPSGWGARQ